MKTKKRYITLIEMMIVMFIIAMIIGILGYNYSGFLEKGKAFKTQAGIEKLEDWLSLRIAEDPGLDVEGNWEEVVKNSPIVKNSKDLIYDGWGEKYNVQIEDGHINVTSRKLERYKEKNPGSFGG